MHPLQAIAVATAGVLAGMINTVVGSGTLITFPVLLAVGLPPVTANVSNSLGLVPGSLAGAVGYRRELTGQRGQLVRLGTASSLGGVGGAVLLLILPASVFQAVVPILIGLAVVLVIVGPPLARRLETAHRHGHARVGAGLWVGMLAAGLYGGYFGAAQGVIVFGLLGALSAQPPQRINGLKNALTALVNLVAGMVFIFVAHVSWWAVLFIALGSAIGGVFGARIGRRLSPLALRMIVVLVGLVAMIKLLVFP